jgi:hypothetical protein
MHPLGRSAEHWDSAYAQGEQTRSWFQQYPGASLRMLDAVGVTRQHSVIDIGGGASLLCDAPLERGHEVAIFGCCAPDGHNPAPACRSPAPPTSQ